MWYCVCLTSFNMRGVREVLFLNILRMFCCIVSMSLLVVLVDCKNEPKLTKWFWWGCLCYTGCFFLDWFALGNRGEWSGTGCCPPSCVDLTIDRFRFIVCFMLIQSVVIVQFLCLCQVESLHWRIGALQRHRDSVLLVMKSSSHSSISRRAEF